MFEIEERKRVGNDRTVAADSPEQLLHDLKQPLNLIRMTAQELKLDVKKDRLDVRGLPDRMAEIENAVDELVAQINRLCTSGGFEAGKQES